MILSLTKKDWQNWTLDGYFESIEAWLRAMGIRCLSSKCSQLLGGR
jgi:hypothetical protein